MVSRLGDFLYNSHRESPIVSTDVNFDPNLFRTTWRTMFYLVAGLAVVCIIGALFVVEPDQPSTEHDTRVDWLGVLLVTAGLVLIVFVLSDGEVAPKQWSTPCEILSLPSDHYNLIHTLLGCRYHSSPGCRSAFGRQLFGLAMVLGATKLPYCILEMDSTATHETFPMDPWQGPICGNANRSSWTHVCVSELDVLGYCMCTFSQYLSHRAIRSIAIVAALLPELSPVFPGSNYAQASSHAPGRHYL